MATKETASDVARRLDATIINDRPKGSGVAVVSTSALARPK